jgi:hypothetical protein
MRFAQPLGFWLLLLVPLVVLLRLLRANPPPTVVPSLILWRDVAGDIRARTPAARWPFDPVLLVQVGAIVAGALAVAQPYMPTGSASASHVVFVLDVSASMGASDVTPSRLGAASRAIRRDVGRLPPGTRVALVLAGPRPELRVGFTGNRDTLLRALDNVGPTAGGARLDAAVALAQAVSRGASFEVRVFTDETFPQGATDVHVFRARGENLSISEMAASRDGALPRQYSVRVRLRNHGSVARTAGVALEVDGVPTDAQKAEVPASGSADVSFSGETVAERDVVLGAHLDVADALAADNHANALLLAAVPLRVAAVGRRSAFLDAILAVAPGVVVRHVSAETYVPTDDVHLTIFNGSLPERSRGGRTELPPGDSLAIAPEEGLPFVRRTGSGSRRAVTWDRGHPLTAFADFRSFTTSPGAVYHTTPAARVLVSGEAGPLIALWEHDESRVVFLAFDAFNLSETDFPLRPVSVVFFSNLLEWARQGARLVPAEARPGEAVRLRAAPGRRYTVQRPDGVRVPVANGVVAETTTAGVYRVLEDGRESALFAVNTAPDESDIAAWQAAAPGEARATREAAAGGRRELWHWLAAAMVSLLLAEWWLYHRRA